MVQKTDKTGQKRIQNVTKSLTRWPSATFAPTLALATRARVATRPTALWCATGGRSTRGAARSSTGTSLYSDTLRSLSLTVTLHFCTDSHCKRTRLYRESVRDEMALRSKEDADDPAAKRRMIETLQRMRQQGGHTSDRNLYRLCLITVACLGPAKTITLIRLSL